MRVIGEIGMGKWGERKKGCHIRRDKLREQRGIKRLAKEGTGGNRAHRTIKRKTSGQ